nr:MAG TPA: hypothetical protein [Caudoviricetes sp.]
MQKRLNVMMAAEMLPSSIEIVILLPLSYMVL